MDGRCYLEEPVERHPEEQKVSEEFDKGKRRVHNPVRQPLGVIILLFALNSLHAKT